MRPVVWSQDALDDITAAVVYIARDQYLRALSVADRIEKSAEHLSAFATGHPGRVASTYEKAVSDLPYTIVYTIETSADRRERIVVLRVIHNARHWSETGWPE